MTFIPWAQPHYWGREREYVADALASTWISDGPYLKRFEHDIASYCDMPHALAVANGTAALHLAYLAIGLKAKDEVVVPGFGFLTAANVALHLGAKPVFAEIDPATWCVTAEGIEKMLTPRTRAVVAVHSYGNACEMDPILDLCKSRGMILIEDAAESFGTRYKGRHVGTLADIGTFSFQAIKTITTGEGGMVLTRHEEWIEPLKLYRSHGMAHTRYWHEVAGLNYRLTNLQAALGCAQLEQMEAIVRARRRMDAMYRRHLADAEGITLQAFAPTVDPVVWAFALKLDPRFFPQGRDAVMAQLTEAAIETRPGFYSANTMPHLYGDLRHLPICDETGRQVISLPSYASLSEEDIARVCAALLQCRNRA